MFRMLTYSERLVVLLFLAHQYLTPLRQILVALLMKEMHEYNLDLVLRKGLEMRVSRCCNLYYLYITGVLDPTARDIVRSESFSSKTLH